jgi:hypothetical protein
MTAPVAVDPAFDKGVPRLALGGVAIVIGLGFRRIPNVVGAQVNSRGYRLPTAGIEADAGCTVEPG